MADLLECLIQINALRETLALADTGARSAAGPEPAGASSAPVWQRLRRAEERYTAALMRDGGGQSGGALPSEDAAEDVAAFLRMRRANLAVLDACTADQLAAPVEWPGRRSTAVADLVAIMLASDTEILGALRRIRSVFASRTPPRDPT